MGLAGAGALLTQKHVSSRAEIWRISEPAQQCDMNRQHICRAKRTQVPRQRKEAGPQDSQGLLPAMDPVLQPEQQMLAGPCRAPTGDSTPDLSFSICLQKGWRPSLWDWGMRQRGQGSLSMPGDRWGEGSRG